MSLRRGVTVLTVYLGLSGVSNGLADFSEIATIKPGEWIKHQRNLHTTITVQQIKPRVLLLKYKFEVPMGIVIGDVLFISSCVAGHFSAAQGFEGWSLGHTNDERKNDENKNRLDAESHLVFLNQGESPQQVSGLGNVIWSSPNFNENPSYREYCSRILRPEYMWKLQNDL